MNKALEVLNDLRNNWCSSNEQKERAYDIIEEYLNALDIMLKYVDIQNDYDEFFPYAIVDKQYVSSRSSLVISKDEYLKWKSIYESATNYTNEVR